VEEHGRPNDRLYTVEFEYELSGRRTCQIRSDGPQWAHRLSQVAECANQTVPDALVGCSPPAPLAVGRYWWFVRRFVCYESSRAEVSCFAAAAMMVLTAVHASPWLLPAWSRFFLPGVFGTHLPASGGLLTPDQRGWITRRLGCGGPGCRVRGASATIGRRRSRREGLPNRCWRTRKSLGTAIQR